MDKKDGTPLDRKLVEEIASLARLDLTGAEMDTFAAQFSDILEYFSILDDVDTSDIPPATRTGSASGTPREDDILPSVTRERFLANVPRSKDGYVVVPRIHNES